MSELSADGFVRENRFDQWTLFGRVVPDWALVSWFTLQPAFILIIFMQASTILVGSNIPGFAAELFGHYLFGATVFIVASYLCDLKKILD